jgi:hypothetical protein
MINFNTEEFQTVLRIRAIFDTDPDPHHLLTDQDLAFLVSG